MKVAPRTVAAALAVAAIAATSLMHPVQPAEAATGPDLAVIFDKMDGPLYDDGLQGARFAIRNVGPAPTGQILAVRVCRYWKFQEKNGQWSTVHYEKQMPLVTLAPLAQGQATTTLVQCPRDEGLLAPQGVTLKLAAQPGEINTANNTA